MKYKIKLIEQKFMAIMDAKDKRIKELEKAAMKLFDMVHESDLIYNKIKANELYNIIKPKEPFLTIEKSNLTN